MKKFLMLLFSFVFYSSFSQTWQTLAPLPLAFSFPVVVVLNGEIHVMGGGASGGATDMHIRYKPSTNTWDTLPPVPYKAQQPAGAVVNGKIHFCGGGYPNTGSRLDSHYYFDPDSNKWFAAKKMPVATAIHKAVSFDNKLYVLTGQPEKMLCEIYDPVTDSWTQKNMLPDQNFWYGAIVSDTKAIYRFGGGGFTAPQSDVYAYDKSNDAWNALPSLPTGLHGVDAAVVNDSFIYITGGYNLGDKDKVWRYNINSKSYVSVIRMPAARSYHNMVTIGNCIYSVGGNNNAVPSVATSLLKYCPAANEVGIELDHRPLPYAVSESNGWLEISIDPSSGSNGNIRVMDLSGKIIYDQKINSMITAIDTRNWNSSLYTIQICLPEGIFIERKIIYQ
jgi:N-acetylneuraminic acid mutarotase